MEDGERQRIRESENVMTSIREHVRDNRRHFCCAEQDPCTDPQYPQGKPSKQGCKSFRCSRCKATVGWCRGGHHGDDHPANSWCDACFVEVYLHPVDQTKKALRRFIKIKYIDTRDDLKPSIEIVVHRYGSQPWHIMDAPIMKAVRKAGVKCPVSINGRILNDEGEAD